MIKTIDTSKVNEYKFALIETEKGTMKLKLFGDEAPQTVCNFATLANEGFYKDLNFHRVIPNFCHTRRLSTRQWCRWAWI